VGVETGLIVAVSIVVVAAFAAPWLWPAMERSAKAPRPEPSRVPDRQTPPVPRRYVEHAPFEIDRDEVVLRLRRRGLTYRQIAERLSGDFGQHMSESTARRIWQRAQDDGRPRDGDRRREAGSRSHGGRRTMV
jgi:hypothetical protein